MQQLATGVFSRGADLSVFGVVILIFIPSFHMFYPHAFDNYAISFSLLPSSISLH